MESTKRSILIIAGEVSGDQRAAELIQALRKKSPELVFFGIGGERMRNEGVETLHDVEDMAVMGLSEVLRRLSFFRGAFKRMIREAETRKPEAVILVDYPGFNLRFAARAHAMGIKVIYYICPQVWAWNRRRIPRMAKIIDRLISIFPFEADHFEGTGLQVDFAGHPLVDEAARVMQDAESALPWKGKPNIAILPGSRKHEIERMLPEMLGAATQILQSHPDASFIIPTPDTDIQHMIENEIRKCLDHIPDHIAVVAGSTRQVLRQARAAMVTSGTATVEASLMRCPMIIVYRVAPLTYIAGKLLVKVNHIGMVNVIANERICPELLQGNASASTMANQIEPLISDEDARARMLIALDSVNAQLGPGKSI
jgi:lipid-A-disaccharide synthase